MSKRNDFTERFLKKHLKPGMKILDIGTGNGEVAFIAAKIVGEAGAVHGIDINANSINSAKDYAKSNNINNCTFEAVDLNNLESKKYDAIIGRRILMYLSEPQKIVTKLTDYLKQDGLFLFQESDASAANLLNSKDYKHHIEALNIAWDTVRSEGGNPNIGSQLYEIMINAKLQVLEVESELIINTPENGSDLIWLLKIMENRVLKRGVSLNIDEMEQKLKAELASTKNIFIRDMAVGICAKNLIEL